MQNNQQWTSLAAAFALVAVLVIGQFFLTARASGASPKDADKVATKTAGEKSPAQTNTAHQEEDMRNKPDSYWKAKLSPEAYYVTRQKGTERAFTGAYWNNHETGKYYCSNCGALLLHQRKNSNPAQDGQVFSSRRLLMLWTRSRTRACLWNATK